MSVVAVFEHPSLTREKYEESVRKITGGKTRMQSPADWPVAGLLAHVAGQEAGASACRDRSRRALQRLRRGW